jgi:hypothetical protein
MIDPPPEMRQVNASLRIAFLSQGNHFRKELDITSSIASQTDGQFLMSALTPRPDRTTYLYGDGDAFIVFLDRNVDHAGGPPGSTISGVAQK